jgi:uncharacterized membrane protein
MVALAFPCESFIKKMSMKYETFEIIVDSNKIGVSNDPKHTKNKGLRKQGLYECFLVKEEFYGLVVSSKGLLETEVGRKMVLLMLLKEIGKQYIKK